jgi:hypothetical protein
VGGGLAGVDSNWQAHGALRSGRQQIWKYHLATYLLHLYPGGSKVGRWT